MANKYMIALAQYLKQEQGERSQRQFAKELGIPNQTLSRYMRCEREIGVGNLCKIADALNEDIDIILGRREY